MAVISVIIYHLNASWLPGGFVGVDVFFVISGFVVSASIAHFKGVNFWRFLAFFYARRIKRIFPALIVCLLVTGYVSALFIPNSWLSDLNQQTQFFAFAGLSNFILAANGRDYFAPTTDFNPFTHTWSLGVEEQFYLIFPVLFCAWLYGQRGKRASVVLFGVGVVVSLIFSAWQSRVEPTNAYFLSPGRFWELGAGVLLYQIITLFSKDGRRSQDSLSGFIGTSAFVGLLISFAISTPNNFPMPGAILAVISTLGIIFSLYKKSCLPWLQALLGNRYILFFGKSSYSLYLWHWPTFVLFRWTCGLDTWVTRLAALAITFLLATLSYFLVEKSTRRIRTGKKLNNPAIIIAGLCIIGLAYKAALVIDAQFDKISASVVTKDANLWYPDRVAASEDYPGCTANPQAIVDEGVKVLVFKPERCLLEKPSRYNVLHVIGDSHTLAYEALYKQFAIKNNLEIDVYSNGGCPFISFQPERDLDNPMCMQNTQDSLRALHKRVKPGDVLLLASLRLPRFSDQWVYFGTESHQKTFFSAQAQSNRERSIKYAISTLRSFTSKGVQVVFDAPKPIFKLPPYRCSDWFNRDNPICSHGMTMDRDLLQTYRAPVLASYEQVIRALPTVTIWDPFPVLCPGKICSVWSEGHSMFFDGDHLSAFGNMKLLPDFSAFMLPRMAKQIPAAMAESVYNFKQDALPNFFDSVAGLSHRESWGRWSDANLAPAVTLAYVQPLPTGFTLEITAQAFTPNIGKPISVIVGNEQQSIVVSDQPTVVKIHFSNLENANKIVIVPPYPRSPLELGINGDNRKLGVGLISVKIITD